MIQDQPKSFYENTEPSYKTPFSDDGFLTPDQYNSSLEYSFFFDYHY